MSNSSVQDTNIMTDIPSEIPTTRSSYQPVDSSVESEPTSPSAPSNIPNDPPTVVLKTPERTKHKQVRHEVTGACGEYGVNNSL